MQEKYQIKITGRNKQELLQNLREQNMELNEYAMEYIRSDAVQVSQQPEMRQVVTMNLQDMEFVEPQSLGRIYERIQELGYGLCPADTGIYLRLHWTNQRESKNHILTGTHTAPEGAVTIASLPLSQDDDFPKGLYLRRVDGTLWLRGYVCDETYLWELDSQFAVMNRTEKRT